MFQNANKNGQERRWECTSVLSAFLSFSQAGKERSTAYFLRIISNLMQLVFKLSDSNLDDTNFAQGKLRNITPDLYQCEQNTNHALGFLVQNEAWSRKVNVLRGTCKSPKLELSISESMFLQSISNALIPDNNNFASASCPSPTQASEMN